MIPDQFPKKTTTIEVGKTYFRVNSVGSGELFTPASKVAANAWPESTYYGPIDTTPPVIDLSHFDLSKIEPKTPDRPGLYWCTDLTPCFNGLVSVAASDLEDPGCNFTCHEYRFLCDFIPPKQSPVIPPLPTVKLYAVEQLGVVKWCHKSISGFWTADGLQAFGDPDAVPIAEKVVTVTEYLATSWPSAKVVGAPRARRVTYPGVSVCDPVLQRLCSVFKYEVCDGEEAWQVGLQGSCCCFGWH